MGTGQSWGETEPCLRHADACLAIALVRQLPRRKVRAYVTDVNPVLQNMLERLDVHTQVFRFGVVHDAQRGFDVAMEEQTVVREIDPAPTKSSFGGVIEKQRMPPLRPLALFL